MYPEWQKRRLFELHLAWLVQGPRGYHLLFKVNPYSLYGTREEALEAARALLRGRLDQDPRVGPHKAPVLLSEEDRERFLVLLEGGKALLPLDRYALLGEVAEVEERLLHRAPFRDPTNVLHSLQGLPVRLLHTPLNDPEAEGLEVARGVLRVLPEGIQVGETRLRIPTDTAIEGLAYEDAFFTLGEGRYYLHALSGSTPS
ncbi:hypothetical protein [Thermus thermamylovorans]|uniref:Uncharacterized protein n=1 Tax=Thermus thermamylovorans TaxID=2509362 RepID=A0A4Q9B7H7_9DEIN|nr:hypothetical protein [Thermus thermamylovorans]TBH21769.1 hypothetical protein ETP66_00575 [Thermus thermamylovorans]